MSVAGEPVDGAVQEELEEDGGQIQVCECRCVRAGLEVVNGTPAAAAVWLDGGKSESLRESWVCQLWAEAAAAGGWLEERRLGRSAGEEGWVGALGG
ncbi:hypothetical protein H0E87_007541 [Populus deltoides]|uniref:Uncharacterized protein n=1 Tax=Populus deltoides TaxID=3696 RepID=A0A8T2ZBV1_POPDE|nr:hypothetical protein H0E87_007541 [Populus deltoides]